MPGRVSNFIFGILKMTLMASRTDDGNRCGISERLDGPGRATQHQGRSKFTMKGLTNRKQMLNNIAHDSVGYNNFAQRASQ